MRITQGAFSFLPDLTDDQIRAQVQYCIDNKWAVSLEVTDDPHPRNVYWEMWDHPMFDNPDAAALMMELNACRKLYGDRYIRVVAFESSHGWESVKLSFIVNRPAEEPGYRLERQEAAGRMIRYTTRPYAADKPAGTRYG
ncbi:MULTISPECIES: ribulose bisphosphate carboxylase small subunit [Mesorhizobium]|uniref:Ribulose bisphosphate carboxylase small subunit n=1 Tax=Mesorhizobium shonense TaxID=1209948 RepID=A0ABV2HPG1_9HYPH|nr:ribulose bisphosphate carboxylase small subunit [Mesorhizobium sp.]RWE00828.1 MAG: ribulose bisphosphate carboxylase small subunit [Mesorhizobium sp.]